MKTKKFSKRLVLNKETVANLSSKEKNKVKGGGLPTWYTLCLYTCTGRPCVADYETDEFVSCPTCWGFTNTCETRCEGECVP